MRFRYTLTYYHPYDDGSNPIFMPVTYMTPDAAFIARDKILAEETGDAPTITVEVIRI